MGEGQSANLSIKIHEGMRAVTIAVDEIKAGGTACQPGDRVDIIASYQEPRTRREVDQDDSPECLGFCGWTVVAPTPPLMLVELPRP